MAKRTITAPRSNTDSPDAAILNAGPKGWASAACQAFRDETDPGKAGELAQQILSRTHAEVRDAISETGILAKLLAHSPLGALQETPKLRNLEKFRELHDDTDTALGQMQVGLDLLDALLNEHCHEIPRQLQERLGFVLTGIKRHLEGADRSLAAMRDEICGKPAPIPALRTIKIDWAQGDASLPLTG